MSLLTIIQGAAIELAFSQPATAFASTDPAVQLMVQLSDKEGKELARRFDWQTLQEEATFTATATETQVSNIITTWPYFDHIVNDSMWNRTQAQRIRGPLTIAQWQQKKAVTAQAGFGNWFRIRQNVILFYPVGTSGDTIAFEYINKNWCQSAGGGLQSAWANDTDTARIDEEIIRLGVVWRFRKAKGFDYGEDFRTYEMALQDRFGSDGGRPVVDMTGDEPVFGVNLAEGSWNIV